MAAKSEQNDRFRRLVERIAMSALEGKYQQHRLLHSCREFESFLSQRDLSFFYRGLESLWDLGILRPIAIVRKTEGQEIAAGLAPLPGLDEQYWVDVRPLPLTLARRPADESVSKLANEALYHPFQVWQAKLVSDYLRGVIGPLAALGHAHAYLRAARRVRSMKRDGLKQLLSRGPLLDSYKLLGVLLDIAPVSLPWVTRRIVGGFDEPVEQYWSWRRSHQPDGLLAQHGVTPEDFRRWHEGLALSATRVDPLADWFALTQQVDLEHRKPLESSLSGPRGSARLAQDLYLMAQALRSYAAEFLGLDLSEEDAVRLGPAATGANERFYGLPYVTLGSRDVRRRVAREYGTESGIRVVWFVEGDTEIGFIERYSAEVGIALHDRGVAVRNLEGVGGLKSSKLRQLLKEARDEQQFVFVTADDEGEAGRELRALARSESVTAGFRLWTGRCLETANFSDDELALITAEYFHLPKKHRFTGTQLSTARKQAKSIKDAINACLAGSTYSLQTGREWGEELAHWALCHPVPDDLREGAERPIVGDFLFLALHTPETSYADTVAGFRVGDGGRLEERPRAT